MQAFTFVSCMSVLTACMLAYTYATVGGQYSVNVHFVPPLVTATCQVAQFWSPPNVTCALCFCMTGSLSRCIPQPGCNPQAQNSTSTTASPGNSTATDPTPSTDGDMTPTEMTPADKVPNKPPTTISTTTIATPANNENPGGGDTPAAKRAAKPVKSRRRRNSS